MGFSIGRALGGAGNALGEIANKYIDQDLAMQRQQAFLDMQRASNQQAMTDKDTFENDPARRTRMAQLNAQDITISGKAKGAVDLESAIAAATNEDLTKALTARAGAEQAAKSANTDRDVMPGGQVMRDGKMIYENTRKTNAEVSADLYGAGLKGPTGGKTSKADHFDEKEWDATKKVEPALVTFVDGATGAKVESPELRTVYLSRLNALRANGDMSPNEATEAARNDTLKLKNKAQDMVDAARDADPKSKLTEQQAVQKILKAFKDAQRASSAPQPAPAPAAAPAPAPVAPPAVAAAPAASLAAQAAASPAMQQMSAIQLSGIAQSPRSSPQMRAQAQAEMDRRAAQQPQANADPTFDPANYQR